jgi:hypothetical protein
MSLNATYHRIPRQPFIDLVITTEFMGMHGVLCNWMRVLVLVFLWRLKSLGNLSSAPRSVWGHEDQ